MQNNNAFIFNTLQLKGDKSDTFLLIYVCYLYYTNNNE